MADFMDELFNEEEAASSEHRGERDRTNSDFEAMFQEVGLGGSPASPSGASDLGKGEMLKKRVSSLDDVDSFLKGLEGSSSDLLSMDNDGANATSSKLEGIDSTFDNDEKDEFLNWLSQENRKQDTTQEGEERGKQSERQEGQAAVGSDDKDGGDLFNVDAQGPSRKKDSVISIGSMSFRSVSIADEDDDDDDDPFFINQSGELMVAQPVVAETSNNADDLAGVDNSQGVLVEKRRKEEPLLPLPSLRQEKQDSSDSGIVAWTPGALESVMACKLPNSDPQGLVAKVASRVETLFEIEQNDASALRSAVAIKGIAGRVVPPQMRADIWSAILLAPRHRIPGEAIPEWFTLQEARLSEIFPSVRKCIRKDCHRIWSALSREELVDEATVDSLVGFVCRLVFRQNSRAYNNILARIAVTVCWVCAQGDPDSGTKLTGSDFERAAKLVQALFSLWGGRSGDWSSTGLVQAGNSLAAQSPQGVGGAAWAAETLPLVSLRRQLLLSKLIAFHDPQLAIALESAHDRWNPASAAPNDGAENDASEAKEQSPDLRRALDKVMSMAASIKNQGSVPAEGLFGALASFPKSDFGKQDAALDVVAFWDSIILWQRSPQLMSFFFAAAALILVRQELLDANEKPPVENAMHLLLSKDAHLIHRLIALAEALVDATPADVKVWLGEEELLLRIPTTHELAAFDAERVDHALAARLEVEREAKAAEAAAAAAAAAAIAPNVVQSVSEAAVGAEDNEDPGSHSVGVVGEDDVGTVQAPPLSAPSPTASASSSATASMSSRAGWMASALKRRAQDFKTALTTSSASVAGRNALDLSKLDVDRRLVEFKGAEGEPMGLSLVKGRYGLEVLSVAENSVAERTGLVHPGDIVMSLNGVLILGLSSQDAEVLIMLQERPVYLVVATVKPKRPQSARDSVGSASSAGLGDNADKSLSADEEKLPTTTTATASALCPGLGERVDRYYEVYNKEKAGESAKILAIYSHRESVLLEELAFKYLDHLEGDPFYSPLSAFCVPVDPKHVISQVCFKQEAGESGSEPQKDVVSSKKLFLVDVRSQRAIASTGRFATCYVVDPASLSSPETQEELRQVFAPMRGDMQIVVMGSGSDAMVNEFNPRRARLLREKDRRAVDTCTSFLLRLGFPFVGAVEGGFLGCYMAMREMGYELEDCLVNTPPSSAQKENGLTKYDSFIRYRKASPTVVAQFLASKARAQSNAAAVTTSRDERTETATSFSGLPDSNVSAKAQAAAAASRVSNMLGNVWKAGSTAATAASAPQETKKAGSSAPDSSVSSIGDQVASAAASDSPEATTSSKPAVSATSSAAAAASSTSAFFSSLLAKKDSTASIPESITAGASKEEARPVDSHTPPAPSSTGNGDSDAATSSTTKEPALASSTAAAAAASNGNSWGSSWSSRFKGIKVPDTTGLSSKLRSSVNQAYTTASQKLATVATDLNTPYDETAAGKAAMTQEGLEEDPAAIELVATLEKGDTIALKDAGRHSSHFDCDKELRDDQGTVVGHKKRWLLVTRDRLLVLEPHKKERGVGHIKSTRSLKLVERMRYPNNDPSSITLFYNKGTGQPKTCTYRFPSNAKAFTKSLMLACARYNSANSSRQETKSAGSETVRASDSLSQPKPQIKEKLVPANDEPIEAASTPDTELLI